MLISRVCCELPQLVHQDLTIQQVIQKMTEEHSNGYVVVNAADDAVGVVSLQDIAIYIVPEEFRKNTSMAQAMYKPGFFYEVCQQAKDIPISQVMRTDFVTVNLETSMMVVLAEFLERSLYLLPVIEHGKIVGVITRSQVRDAIMHGIKDADAKKD